MLDLACIGHAILVCVLPNRELAKLCVLRVQHAVEVAVELRGQALQVGLAAVAGKGELAVLAHRAVAVDVVHQQTVLCSHPGGGVQHTVGVQVHLDLAVADLAITAQVQRHGGHGGVEGSGCRTHSARAVGGLGGEVVRACGQIQAVDCPGAIGRHGGRTDDGGAAVVVQLDQRTRCACARDRVDRVLGNAEVSTVNHHVRATPFIRQRQTVLTCGQVTEEIRLVIHERIPISLAVSARVQANGFTIGAGISFDSARA